MMQLAPREAAAVHAVPLPTERLVSVSRRRRNPARARRPSRAPWSVDSDLRHLLERLRAAAGGAVALVSGRTIENLDRLLGGPEAAARGSARLRAARRRRRAARRARRRSSSSRTCATASSSWSQRHPGLLLEDKGAGLALHFLKARELEHELRAEVALLAAPLVPHFAVLDGHAVIEVKPAAHTKDSAVTAYMEEAPFAAARRSSSATTRPTTTASPRCAASTASRSPSGRA